MTHYSIREFLRNPGLLLGLIFLLLLSGCSSDSSPSSSQDSINTLNLLFTDQQILSFNPETGIATRRANYDAGENKIFKLDTDDDKQGFEFIAYVRNDRIYSMNYVDAKTTELANADIDVGTSGEVCGIFPQYRVPQSAFDRFSNNKRTLLNKTSIMVATNNGTTCDPATNNYSHIAFSLTDEGEVDSGSIELTEINSSLVLGDPLLDFTFTPRRNEVDEFGDDVLPGRTGFLGYDIAGMQLRAYDKNFDTIWDTPFPFINKPPTVQQVSDSEVMIHNDGEIYVLQTAKIFTVATDSDVTNQIPNIPASSRIADLFVTFKAHDMQSSDNSSIQFATNKDSFVIADDGALLFYDRLVRRFVEVAEKDTDLNDPVVEINFALTGDKTVVLHQIRENSEVLSRINTDSKVATTIAQAQRIQYSVMGNTIYLNTLGALGQTGWQAHIIDAEFKQTTFENSLFIFAPNSRTPALDNEIYILSSDMPAEEDRITTPLLYAFDESNINTGRKQVSDSNNNTIDFAFGQFASDVLDVIESEVVNDIYGRLSLRSEFENETVNEIYYFGPDQKKPFDTEDKQTASLNLISRVLE